MSPRFSEIESVGRRRVAVLCNPLSGRVHRDRASVGALRAEVGAAAYREASTPDEVGVALDELALGGADALATGLTAALVVAVVVLWFAGLAGASMVRGVVPSLLQTAYDNLLICAGGALGLAIIGAGVTFMLARRGSK